MKEETKEEYLARIRKEREADGVEQLVVEKEEVEVVVKRSLKDRLKSLFLFLLFLLFIYMIFQVFGMLKSN